MELVHGGDWAGYRAEFGRDALDFSANVSPLGLPAGVAAAITAALPMADRYPDPLCRALRTKLAAAEGVDTAQILCGNGAEVRGCGNYPGLDETWYRTAVRTQKENEQLLKIMREVLA